MASRSPEFAMTGAVALSLAGMAYHTVQEFGASGLLHVGTGMIPVAMVQLALLALWWRAPAPRRPARLALATTAALQLVGGAILTILPLPILPFVPEPTVGHFAAHAVYGLCQLPLLRVTLRAPRARAS